MAEQISIPMRATIVEIGPGGLSSQGCLACGSPLVLCQPDPDAPDELVDACSSGPGPGSGPVCGGLHLVCLSPGPAAVLVLLPSARDVREAILREAGLAGR